MKPYVTLNRSGITAAWRLVAVMPECPMNSFSFALTDNLNGSGKVLLETSLVGNSSTQPTVLAVHIHDR